MLFDPLDGSSNTDVNGIIGTIFSVLRCPDGVTEPSAEHFLQPGSQQVAAGMAVYGPQTILVLTTGYGVNGFTLDDTIGEFVLTHPEMRARGQRRVRDQRLEPAPLGAAGAALHRRMSGRHGRPRGRDFNMRWMGAMVGDVYRVLCRGGVFLYPADAKTAKKGGKLRLMYEAQSGGDADRAGPAVRRAPVASACSTCSRSVCTSACRSSSVRSTKSSASSPITAKAEHSGRHDTCRLGLPPPAPARQPRRSACSIPASAVCRRRELRAQLPHEDFPTSPIPGTSCTAKSDAFIRARTLAIAGFLLERRAKLLVVACNTATAAAACTSCAPAARCRWSA